MRIWRGGTLRTTDAAGAFAPLDARDTSITNFAVGQIVVSGTTLYKVTTAHAAPFDTAKAAAVGGAGGGGGVTATVNGTSASSLAFSDATAADVPFTPTGTIAATNVATALAEVASEAAQKSANLSDLASAATARTNLGAGSANGLATLDSGGQVPLAQLGNAPVGGGGSLSVQDEGSALSTAATTLNFVGAGVTATGTGATKTVTIPGSSVSSPYIAGNRYSVGRGPIGTLTVIQDREYAVRWQDEATVITYMGVETTTAVPAATLRFVIRSKTSGGLPGTVVFDSGTVAAATAGAFGATVPSVTVNKGDYLEVIANSGAPGVRSFTANDPGLPRTDGTVAQATGYFMAGTTGTPPTTYTSGGVVSSSPVFSVTAA